MKVKLFIVLFLLSNFFSFSQSKYSLNVKGWEKVVDKGSNVIVIEKVWVKDNTDPAIFGNGDIGLHIFKGKEKSDLKPQFRLYGPHCGGSDNGPHCEWSDNEVVSYSNYGIISWDESYGDQIRIALVEGDDFVHIPVVDIGVEIDTDDLLLDKTINVSSLRNTTVKLEGTLATVWLKMYTVWPAKPKSDLLNDIQFMKPPPSGGGGYNFQEPSSLQEGGSTNYALVGMIVNYGRLVDGITPILREFLPDGALGKIKHGNHVGGTGGDYKKEIYMDGYVVTGLNARIGDKLDNIQLVYKKWSGDKLAGDEHTSISCGGKGGSLYKIRCSTGRIGVGIHGNSGKVTDVISLITAEY